MKYLVSIVGLGNIGMLYDKHLEAENYVLSHSRAFHLHSDFKLVGAVDPNPALRNNFINIYQAHAYSSLEELLAEHRPDILVIASDTSSHAEIIDGTLATYAPKAILCEKPLAYDSIVAQNMVEACTNYKVPLYVNYPRRADPGVKEIKCRIEAGQITMPFKAIVWYSKGLLHNGSHFVDLLYFWFGPIRAGSIIDAGRWSMDHDAEPDARLTFDHGSAIFCAAKEENYSHYTIEIVAKNGRLRYEQDGTIIWQGAMQHPKLKGYHKLNVVAEKIHSDINRYQYWVVDQLNQALRGKKNSLCIGTDALKNHRLIEILLKKRN